MIQLALIEDDEVVRNYLAAFSSGRRR